MKFIMALLVGIAITFGAVMFFSFLMWVIPMMFMAGIFLVATAVAFGIMSED